MECVSSSLLDKPARSVSAVFIAVDFSHFVLICRDCRRDEADIGNCVVDMACIDCAGAIGSNVDVGAPHMCGKWI